MLSRVETAQNQDGDSMHAALRPGHSVASRWEAGIHPTGSPIEFVAEDLEILTALRGSGEVEQGIQRLKLLTGESVEIQGPGDVRVRATGDRLFIFERILIDKDSRPFAP